MIITKVVKTHKSGDIRWTERFCWFPTTFPRIDDFGNTIYEMFWLERIVVTEEYKPVRYYGPDDLWYYGWVETSAELAPSNSIG